MHFMDCRLNWEDRVDGYRAVGPRCEVIAKRPSEDGAVVATLIVRQGAGFAFDAQGETFSGALEELREVVGKASLLPVHVTQWFFGEDFRDYEDDQQAAPASETDRIQQLEERVRRLEETISRIKSA